MLVVLVLTLLGACVPAEEGAHAVVAAEAPPPPPAVSDAARAARLALEREARSEARHAAGASPGRLLPHAEARWISGAADTAGLQLVFFWELWCGPCREEMPRLHELAARYGSAGLDVIGLTALTRGTEEGAARRWLKDQNVRLPMGVIPERAKLAAGAASVPYALLLRDGVVLWRGNPAHLEEVRLVEWIHGTPRRTPG